MRPCTVIAFIEILLCSFSGLNSLVKCESSHCGSILKVSCCPIGPKNNFLYRQHMLYTNIIQDAIAKYPSL